MNLPKFDIDFFDAVLSDWNYKEIYVNNVCVYSVKSDTSITMTDLKEKIYMIENKGMSIKWSSIDITPYDNADGVIIHFNTVVNLFS
jgi:hypothetical protein